MNSETDWTRPWWAGFLVLMISVMMLALCTFFEVKNRELIEIWKYVLFTSLGYVVGVPIGMTASKRFNSL